MKPNTKKYLTWIVIALVLFYLLRDPAQAAATVHGGLDQLQNLASKLITFLQQLFTGS